MLNQGLKIDIHLCFYFDVSILGRTYIIGYCKMQLKNNLQIKMAWFMYILQEGQLWPRCFSWPTRMEGRCADRPFVATEWLQVLKSASKTGSSWRWFTPVEELASCLALPVSPVWALPPPFMYLSRSEHRAYSGNKGMTFHSLFV